MLIEKLNPNRFTGMSPKMAAIVGYIIGANYTYPKIVSMIVTSDNYVLAQLEGDIGANDFVGSLDDLVNNWNNLLKAADDLTIEEITEAQTLFIRRIPRPYSFVSPFTAEWEN